MITITHYFEELENWANKLLILQQGKVVCYGTIDDLKKHYPYTTIFRISKNELLDECRVACKKITYNDVYNGVLVLQENIKPMKEELGKRHIQYDEIRMDLYALYQVALQNEVRL